MGSTRGPPALGDLSSGAAPGTQGMPGEAKLGKMGWLKAEEQCGEEAPQPRLFPAHFPLWTRFTTPCQEGAQRRGCGSSSGAGRGLPISPPRQLPLPPPDPFLFFLLLSLSALLIPKPFSPSPCYQPHSLPFTLESFISSLGNFITHFLA